MADPITPEDLYGPSSPPQPEADQPLAGTPEGVSPIPIEETPEITVESPSEPMPKQAPPSNPASQKPRTSLLSTFGAILLFVGLFIIGILLSSIIRQYLPNGLFSGAPQKASVTESTQTPTPTDPLTTWKTYQVISGTTKLPIEGISFKLPPDILAPICDAITCISQGTYLPGGTRFTVAPRGTGQLLVDSRGSTIGDGSGTVFTTQDTTINGYSAKIFTGSFAGRTVAGYGFSEMRGYMIEVSPTLSLEINHFTPTGVTADFAADDILFDKIVGTLVTQGTPSATPIGTSSPSPATTSGY